MRTTCLALLLVLAPSAGADWSHADTARQLAFTGLLAIDWAQTHEIIRRSDRHELNPILGSDPDRSTTNAYFAAAGIGHYLVSRALPPEYRKVWQYLWIGGQAATVHWNYQMGIRIRF